MYKKLIYLLSFVFLLGVTTSVTNGASLWGYYPINENDLNDHSGNNHHGIAVDGAVTVFDSERGWVVSFKDQPSQPSRINCGTDDPSADGQLSVSVWIKWDGMNGNWQGMAGKSFQYGQRRWILQLRDSDGFIQWGGSDSDGLDIWSDVAPKIGEWQHVAGTCDESYAKVYINGEIVGEGESGFTPDTAVEANVTLGFGEDRDDYDESFNGLMDEIYIYSRILSDNQILDLFHGIAPSFNRADNPQPASGSLHFDVWANLSWSPGDTAVSHDVYFGDNFDDVNDGIESTFQGNQNMPFIIVGFPGFAFPDGLIPGMTYYWRIDEIEANGTTKHKGIVWNFTVPPKTAYDPVPTDGTKSVVPDVELSWTAGYGAKLHTVYFGDNFDDVNNATEGVSQGVTKYSPGTLKMAKTYYWRIDEFDVAETHKGAVWSFTTEGAVGTPDPANSAEDVTQTPTLTWVPGVFADTHEVYFGADADSLELKGSGNLGSESYEAGQLEWNTTYYWRIDEANNTNADSPWTGPLWSFTTAN
ncbi:MAG: LamG domain-containing protein, partial [Planctomycetota bacterium]